MKELKPAILLFLIFTVLCGGVYPALITGIASVAFPGQAGGSILIDANRREIGSALIGQPFSAPGYFWPRPSATADFPYNPLYSGGSNLGPSNPALLEAVAGRVKELRVSGGAGTVPAELVEASASGLDPDISRQAAEFQVSRVALARGVGADEIRRMVTLYTKDRQLGFLGEPRVNVLQLNLALDAAYK